ncbi:predicted protein [Sclerotinia sclerotiorum 1980 UF-70]|uniref:Major facilitator superfamily (MFS) profile domain-containing protein n=1 Tax=Sclerotinia sclerotiorum (strain ATCC 18683 / 1980 / Ss-1) TaxID=665079 RepID=A7EFE6_SCLS1|nr:predicted protein [Sclerotinia sclerotiorum 1980 UF-70]EDO01562.1 predicted protein [Sclerotinia sclerotiorum 1980 UF-70]
MAMLTSSKPSLASTIEVIEEVDLSIPLREPLSPTTYDSEKGTNATSAISSLSASSPPSNLVLTTISSFTLTLSTWGFYNSTGILLSHLSIHNLPDTSLPILSLIPALNILLTLLLFLPLGPIYDTYGPLPLLIPGSLIYILSLALLSFCSSLLHFLLVYGVLSALGMSPLCTVANAMLNTFEGTGYRGLATVFEFVLVGTTGLLPTYALKQGFSTSVSFNVVAIVNAGSILGRLLSGPLSDHLGPYNIVLLCLVSISLLSNFIFFLPTSILPIPSTPTPTPTPTPSSPSTPQILLYLYATLSGLGSGAIMSCAPLCISALCPSNVYARWWGASQLGVAIACTVNFFRTQRKMKEITCEVSIAVKSHSASKYV